MKFLADFIIPPSPGDHKADMKWRITISGVLWTLVLFTIWAANVVPYFPPGLARSDELQELSVQVIEARKQDVQVALFQLRIKQCDTDNPEVRRVYAEQISALLRTYYELTASNYNLPACIDIK